MTRQISFVAFSILLMNLLGCQQQAATPSSQPPVSVGPFRVNSDTRMADGQAFGVTFKAMDASGAEVEFSLSGVPDHSSSATITLASDLNIELETLNDGSSIAFELNGDKICDLAKGDEVVIDEERNVTVNGEDPTK